MVQNTNPLEAKETRDFSSKQTVEFRCPDGSADIYLLLAGLTVAARHGLESEDSLDFAEKTYVDVNIFDDEHKHRTEQLEQLPVSCHESAQELERQRDIYLQYGVFDEITINGIAKNLKSYNDQNIREEVGNDEEKILALVDRFFHCG
jgi:glutamine synthetase